MIPTLLLLGATGDLSRRYLLPALGALHQAGRLPGGFRVVGAAHTALDDEQFRRLAGGALPADTLAYRPVDLADPATLAAALDGTTGPVAAYLALPPGVFATTIESLSEVGLPPGSRIVVEKPFGDDADSAAALNALLAKACEDAYRVDHVLGMETTGNLVAIRRANPLLERIWTGEAVDAVEILWEETLGLEGRAAYFDRAGALKDMLQNHVVQLLALVGMDAPGDDGDLPRRKLEVLRAVRVSASRRARYTAGTLADGREVPAYTDEDGVDPAHGTETFAEVVLSLDRERWSGTQFVLRTGKALAERRKLVRLHFRGGGLLEVGIDGPEEVVLRLPSAGRHVLELRGLPPGDGLPVYAHVLLDVLEGTSAFAVSGEVAEEAWRVVAPVLAAWEAGEVPLEEYRAGSAGLFQITVP
jgi:glucose-6-phosphate 1-dehydrogenase